jgi:hypothetical protein
MDTEQIKDEITKLFGDTSVSRDDTLEALEDIRDHATQFIESIEADIEEDERQAAEEEEGEEQDD